MSKGRATVRTDKARETFLATLADACNVTAACRAAGIGRQTAYSWRDDDEGFARAWDAAVEEAVDKLEAEVWRRGVSGIDKPVTYQGVITGTFKEYSDRMLEILLKAHRPGKFVERIRSENSHAVAVRIEGPQPIFKLTDKQAELLAAAISPARHVLAYGGSRSGKTFGFCYCVANRALMAPDSRHLIARLHNIDVRQAVMLDTWPKMMRLAFPGVPYEVNRTDQYAVLPGESQVWFGGLDDKERVDKILGKEFATIYVNEASQVAYETVPILRTRLSQACLKSDGRPLALKGYYDLNPVGRSHWTYREFVEQIRPENGLPIEPDSRAHVVLNPADNPFLPAEYYAELDGLPDRQRQRFRDGKYLSEVPGALWSLSDRMADDGRVMPGIESLRTTCAPALSRIVIGVDPSGSDGTGGDSQGIVVAGRGTDGHGYVLADLSCRQSPDGWARVVAQAAERYGADRVVAERNYGGAMVEAVLRSAAKNLPIRMVNASRGTVLRAEPVAALYEQGKVHHVGHFGNLEEQMTMTTTNGYAGGGSPDRLDALVWALTEVMGTAPSYDIDALI